MSAKYISKYRSVIMGLAILMIMFFHTDIRYPVIIDVIKNYNDFGVNLFYAISGFSMCFAWKKDPNTLIFLRNRFLRIAITLLPISIVWNLLSYITHEITTIEAVCKILTIQFWIDGNLLQWFVSGILVFYFITPFWMKLYCYYPKICFILTVIICTFCLIQPFHFLNYIKIFVQRVPTYFIGLYLGKHVINQKDDKNIHIFYTWIFLILGIIGFALIGFDSRNYIWKYKLYIVLTFPALMLISYICKVVKVKESGTVLSIFGAMTLEIYLIQEKILKISYLLLNKIGITLDPYNIVINVIVICLTIISAFFYNKITSYTYKKIRQKFEVTSKR